MANSRYNNSRKKRPPLAAVTIRHVEPQPKAAQKPGQKPSNGIGAWPKKLGRREAWEAKIVEALANGPLGTRALDAAVGAVRQSEKTGSVRHARDRLLETGRIRNLRPKKHHEGVWELVGAEPSQQTDA